MVRNQNAILFSLPRLTFGQKQIKEPFFWQSDRLGFDRSLPELKIVIRIRDFLKLKSQFPACEWVTKPTIHNPL